MPLGFSLAAGLNSHKDGTTITGDSLFPSGSATKLYTSVAILQLHEKGIIDIDEPVHKIVDPFLQRTNKTTLFGIWKDEKITIEWKTKNQRLFHQ